MKKDGHMNGQRDRRCDFNKKKKNFETLAILSPTGI